MTNIKDIAKMAGVSVTTVSRVLNNHPYVKEDKRKAVQDAVQASKYFKNLNAVHLSKGKTNLVGVVLPYSDHPYFTQIVSGIASQALESNYKLVLFQTDYKKDRETEALQMLKQKQIDALIICSRACGWATIDEYLSYGPIVLAEDVKEKRISSTYVNHYKIFMEALEYLYQKGHRRIGYCISRKTGTNSRQREQAYIDFHRNYNITYQRDYIIDKYLYFEDGQKVINRLKKMDAPPTALLVTNDQAAAGIVASSQKQGINIPGQLAIIGFDNQPIAQIMDITTIEIPLVEMGKNLFRQAVGEGISNKEFAFRFIGRSTV